MHLPTPRETTEDIIVYMNHTNDPAWQSTPGSRFIGAPLWLTPNFFLGLEHVLGEDEYSNGGN